MMTALLEIENVSRVFRTGDKKVNALAGVSLSISSGELVAIVGNSGSGKTTLMNILGCLDQPSSGDYRIGGRSVAGFSADELAASRRQNFGFIFQHYQLLATLSAVDNVAIPAIYASVGARSRRERSISLLRKLGLDDRLDHRPNQLSGGQQQRVSIARALMNGGRIILADEPTGALDAKSGGTVLDILKELHVAGHTIIIVTHDPKIAAHADRIVEIRDGVVVSDRLTHDRQKTDGTLAFSDNTPIGALSAVSRCLLEALRMAIRSLVTNRMRTFLTVLSIIIGIAAVLVAVGFGEGARQKLSDALGAFGYSVIEIVPERNEGDGGASNIKTLVAADADALADQSYIASATPEVQTPAQMRFGHTSVAATVFGVGQNYLQVKGLKLVMGSFLSAEAVSQRHQEAVIDERTALSLFSDDKSPLGKIVLISRVPVVIIGVFAQPPWLQSREAEVLLPYTVVKGRLQGPGLSLDALAVRVVDSVDATVAERAIVDFLTRRHETKDFAVYNYDQMRKSKDRASQTMWQLSSSLAAISLVVGGVGVMNMMLISVTVRTHEIGLRLAVGARRIDIMVQFLTEAVAICAAGSLLGVALAIGIAAVWGRTSSGFPMVISAGTIVPACALALGIGLIFGFLPARKASRLNPIDALSRD
ncbi:ATP-binding cassette domain-containing protein [Rhizobium laguerreae]|uniref:ABC transporter permease n=1 Tax=Rhizobium laguerreae TaxID=1076926 RepID=UPI001C908BF4|nr:ABC transporter permease [Rhizobium laguerreae]MBY3517242.1 ATP-binding cassette domain-containing protein [Rhizobium laguerreae]